MLSPGDCLPYRGPMAAPQPIPGNPPISELGDQFYDAVKAAEFPTAIPRFLNRRWAERVGLGNVDWEKHFARFEPLPGNLEEPLALRYHGHQFRVYNPDIGDGRGFLFAQVRDDRGRLLDLGTKGSGQTPYSRRADGRLTLKGGVREVLATEMLEALGVNTSKSFALFETGEELWRGDEPSPTRSSVLTRLSHGHIRIGTFQRFAFFEDVEAIAKLTRYCLDHLLGRAGWGRRRKRPAPVRSGVQQHRDAGRQLYRRRLCPWRAQQRQYQHHWRELRLWPVAVRAASGTKASPPPISTRAGSTPSAASPRRSSGTWRSWAAAWR